MAGPWEVYQEKGPWESYQDVPVEIPKSVFRKKIERPPEGADPVISAEMGKDEGRPPWVKFADFLTGHFPDNSRVKPEVQTVDGKLQINVPETAEVPFLQSPEMAIGAGAAGALKATGGLAAKVIKGVEEAAGYATGGATDVAKAATRGVKKVAESVVSPESMEAMVKGGKVTWWKEDSGTWAGSKRAHVQEPEYLIERGKGKFIVSAWEQDPKTRRIYARKLSETNKLDEAKEYVESIVSPESLEATVKGGKATVYHGGTVEDIRQFNFDKPLSVTRDKKVADLYAKGGGGVLELELSPTAKIATAKDVPDSIFKRIGKDEIEYNHIDAVNWAKQNGYDGIDLASLDKKTTSGGQTFGGLHDNEIQVFNLEALVKGGRIGNLPKYAEGSSLNLERMDTTQDVLQLQNALSKAAEEQIGKRKVPWNETVQAAEELAWDSKEFLKQAQKKGGFSAAEIHAARQINSNALHDLFKTVKEIPADTSLRTDAMRFGVMDKINNYVEIMKATSQKSSEAGRALNIHRKMIADNPEFAQDALRLKTLQAMLDQNGGRKAIDGMVDDLAKVDFNDPAAVREILQKYHKATVFDMFYEAWMNGILSAPPTHFANIIGNTLTMATKIPESAISSMLKGKMPLGEIKAETVGMIQGLKDGVRLGLKAFQTGVPSDMFTKIETRHMNAIPGKTGEVIRIPTRSLTAADEFFKAIVYRAEMNRQAYLIAEKQGLKGRALGEKMSEILNDPYHKSFKAIHDKAHEESLYRTFNKPLGEFGNSVMKIRDKVPGLRYVIPFIRTPANIAKFAFERTPFNFGKIAFDYKAGKVAREQLSQELAKPIMGTMIGLATTMAVLDGHITGMAPKNKKERDLLYAKGWQPYSVKIGNKYYSYNRLEPIGSIMGMAADFVNESNSESEINEKAGRIMLSISRNLASKTFLQGVSNTLDAISDPERYASSWTERFAGSMIPSVVGRAAAAYDPYVREVETPWEAIQARTPYYSAKLPYKPGAKIGGMELPIERQGTPMQRFLSPMTISEEKEGPMRDVIDAELMRYRLEKQMEKEPKKTKKEAIKEYRRKGF